MKKLNLGSGKYKKSGYINLDWVTETNPDITHDLNKLPYPFKDNEFDLIEADHVLEHLNNIFGTMHELHRISKNGAKLIIRVPHFSRGFSHSEHKRGFDFTFPMYFNKDFKGGYQGFEFTCKKIKLSWFAQRYLKKDILPVLLYYISFYIGGIFSILANLSPMLCSRIWCFWVGGFEEIKFELVVKKV